MIGPFPLLDKSHEANGTELGSHDGQGQQFLDRHLTAVQLMFGFRSAGGKYIDGINHVSRIANLADCDLELTRQAISHLL